MDSVKKKILVVEDEKKIAQMLAYNIKKEGYDCTTVFDGESGLTEALGGGYDLILLDIMLPRMNGYEVCEKVRLVSQVPIIFLTAKEEEKAKILGLDTGADDYVTKPFSPAELTARIDALFRRLGGDSGAVSELLSQGPFIMNTRNHTLEKNGVRIRLTQVEYAIMKLFMQNPGRALSREDILSTVWGRDFEGDLKIVDVNIRRLRIKIEDDTTAPTYITTVWGYGYKWGN